MKGHHRESVPGMLVMLIFGTIEDERISRQYIYE